MSRNNSIAYTSSKGCSSSTDQFGSTSHAEMNAHDKSLRRSISTTT